MRINKLAFKASVVVLFAILLGACDSLPKGEQSVNPSQASVPLYRAGLVLPSDFEYSDQDKLKVISWNVEHFVDQYNDPYVDSRRENEPKNHMGDKRKDLVEALIKENADIVVLQEFESAKLLRDLAENELQELGYRFFADAPSHTWYMNVVIMSRVPLGTMYSYGNANTPVLNWTDEDGQAQSQNRLNTRMWSIDVFPSEDYSFLLSAVHLKAGRGERDIGMRLGQIAFLKHQFKRFLNEDPNRNIMLLGDFNALPNTAEHSAILAGDSKGMSFVDLLEDDEYTHTAADPKRRLDYIVMNQNMLPEIIEDSLRPVSYFDPKKQDALADHLPVVVEFYVKEK